MKFLIIGDLHGRMPRFYYKNFDAIIAPGDFCSDAHRKYIFQALHHNQKNQNSKEITWRKIVGKKKADLMEKKSILDGRKILEKLNSFGMPVYVVPGNWEPKKYWKKKLVKGLKNIIDVHNNIVNIENYNFIGYGYVSSPEYPQHKEVLKEMKKKELKKCKKDYLKQYKKLNSLFVKSKKPVIFLSHNVPHNTKLDMITNKESPKYGYHYGSLIAKQMIEKYQPLVCIGGHMHEHFTKCKVRKTICINAGFGSYVNILLELDENKIKKLEFCNNGKVGTYG